MSTKKNTTNEDTVRGQGGSEDQPAEIDERDTTRNWIPLTVLIIAVPFMLALFVFIGYLICEWRHPAG